MLQGEHVVRGCGCFVLWSKSGSSSRIHLIIYSNPVTVKVPLVHLCFCPRLSDQGVFSTLRGVWVNGIISLPCNTTCLSTRWRGERGGGKGGSDMENASLFLLFFQYFQWGRLARAKFFVYFCKRKRGPVVQLNRMQDSGSWDRGFESRRGHHRDVK